MLNFFDYCAKFTIRISWKKLEFRKAGIDRKKESNIVKELHEFGRSDAWIAKHLGMDRDEILRLKQITGMAALFKDIQFGKAWRPADTEEPLLPPEGKENAFNEEEIRKKGEMKHERNET